MILFVEDDSVYRMKIRRSMPDGMDYQTISCVTGAMELLARGGIKTVVLDYQMQPLNGIQAFHNIKKCYPEIKCLFFTSYDLERLKKETDNLADFYISKQDFEPLLEALNKCLTSG